MQPRLSWQLNADPAIRGRRQTAYQIEVRDSAGVLVWDSGKVVSDQSQLVAYAGPSLESGQLYQWQVRSWDEKDAPSSWSSVAYWTMGMLFPDDWSAQWIGTGEQFKRDTNWPPADNSIADPWFRKTFTLSEKPTGALGYVASVGYHELYVNGNKVGDAVLAPNVADNSQRARYVTYDLAPYLKQGSNCIALWLGNSWSFFPHYYTADKPHSAIVLGQFEFGFADNSSQVIGTDATWKTRASPNTLLGVWDFMFYGGEKYDATKELAGWNLPELDDSAWTAAKTFSPALILTSDLVEPNRLQTQIHPVSVTEVSTAVYKVDMGVNFAGYWQIAVQGAPGQEVTFGFSEKNDEEITHTHHSAYVIGASGSGTFRNRFNYQSGRWLTIRGLSYKPSLADITGWLVRNDYAAASSFQCDNSLLNQIHETTRWTFENLSLGGYVVDCPQRERMGYGGDAHATTKTALLNYNLGAFYTKWAQDWRDVQSEDGNIPYTAPTYWGGGGPSWSGYIITLPWQMYQSYGDVRILEETFPAMQAWLAFLETKQTGNVLQRWGGDWDFLGDWLWPTAAGTNGKLAQTKFFNNCYWIYSLQNAAQIAEILGMATEAAGYKARAEAVRQAVHTAFWNKTYNTYVPVVRGRMGYLAAALLVHLPPDELWPVVWADFEKEITLTRSGFIDSGITGGYFLFEALMGNQRDDLAALMLTKEVYPSFGDMLAKGATTFWEDWEGNSSRLHSSYLWAGAWFIEGAAGLRRDPAHAGWKHFFLHPGIGSGLKQARGTLLTPFGLAVSDWSIKDNVLTWLVEVPPNSTATAKIPTTDATAITEGGTLLASANGVTVLRNDGNAVVVELLSGRYTFSSKWNTSAIPAPTSYEAVIETKTGGPLSPANRRAAYADADGDGQTNLWEFVVGSDPLIWNQQVSGSFQIDAVHTDGQTEITLSLERVAGITGVDYVVEHSTMPGLNPWLPWTGETSTAVVALPKGKERLTLKLRAANTLIPAQSFYRLRVGA
ncbi:MAG: family 78 glycoside hydrolase catalytic domain [Verrucomicrobiota bacterium]|nr:family 78 glycoside hydrolase catalytic domain [Verrucomicrobiota bacterium]